MTESPTVSPQSTRARVVRILYGTFFVVAVLPSLGVIGFLGGSALLSTAQRLAGNPADGEIWSELLLPGLPIVLGFAAGAILATVSTLYLLRGRAAVAPHLGKLVVALILAVVPLLFTLPLGLLTLARESDLEILLMAALGSGAFPLAGTLALITMISLGR